MRFKSANTTNRTGGKTAVAPGEAHRAVPPGEILGDFLGELGLTQYKLAKETAIPHATITRIMKNESRITAQTALRLGAFFGNGAEFWMNCQNYYDLRELRKRMGRSIEREVTPFRGPGKAQIAAPEIAR